ncbi:protein of unknown function [Asanoa hainanensis]|uniref:TLP18.3, Psb32 and MOLO-1 founding protein of phosphatase n=1 Tax=Asanoa hainanensis TaxID=560556 RepID=A0A239MJ59_9ACTN|nr:protein of unknown function [Asanoa hainanensis]
MTAGETGPLLAQHPEAQQRAELIEEHNYGQPEVLEGPFSTRQLLRLDEALRTADRATGLVFSVYVGELEEPVRGHAERMHQQLPDVASAVLIAVSPNQRVLEVVTGGEARRRIPDRDAKLAALSMVAAFGGGDLAGGIISGLDQLATRAGRS